MPTLRDMVDGRTLETVKAASPAATHVAKHIQDPFASTKSDFDDLNKARMDYETKKQNMRMKLAPVQSVVQGIKNMHQLDGPGDGSPLDMSPNNPANMPQQIDPTTGLPIPQTPNDPGAQVDDETGVPQNMNQSPGQQMNMNRPSQAGFQPGVSPGPAESVRPGKMGTPQPGGGSASKTAGNPNPNNMPAGWTRPGSGGTGNQPGQYNKGAAPPKGNRSLPGAKGPGDPKVANRTKKAQNNSGGGSGRPIHVEVRADSMMTNPAMSTVARAAASDVLRTEQRSHNGHDKTLEKSRGRQYMTAYGTHKENHKDIRDQPLQAREFSQGRRKSLAKSGKAMPGGSFPIVNKEDLANAKRAIGRAKNPAAARSWINRRAKQMGAKPIGQNMTARMTNLTQ